MENATKALMIAGAVLLAIMIIAIGMSIYNGAKGSVDAGLSQMNDTEKQILNGKFEPYAARTQTGSQIKTMLASVIAFNQTSEDEGLSDRKIEVIATTVESNANDNGSINSNSIDTISKFSSGIIAGKKYKVELSYVSGVVHKITITDA